MAKKINIGAVLGIEGEKEYRQAISGINSTVKTLKSEMKLLSAEFGENQNSVEALNAKDKVLNKQLEAQKDKVEVLKRALENAKNIYGENDTKVDQWQQSLNDAQAELYKLTDEVKKNQRYLAEAKDSTTGCAKSIDNYGKEVTEAKENTEIFGEVLKANLASEAIVNGVKALASGIKEVSSSMVGTVKDTAAYADDILTMANNTGIATDTLQELKYMQELTDVSLEAITKSMQKNIRSMSDAAEGSANYAKAYEQLGVSVVDSNGALRDSETVFWECIDALGKITNETQRDAIAMDIFGKSAQELNSIIKIGSAGVEEFAEEAHNVGAVLSDDTLEMLGATDDAFQRFDQTVEIVKRNFGVALAPSIERATTKISNAFNDMNNEIYDIAEGGIELFTDGLIWIMDNGEEIISVLGGIGAGMAVYKSADGIGKLVSGLKSVGTSAEGAQSLVTRMGTAIANHPWETAAIAIGVVTTAVIGIAMACKDTESETAKLLSECEELNEATDETISNYENAKKAREDSLSAAESEAGKIQILADKLYDLAESENLSNDEKKEMKTLVDQINKLYPGLNLAIDENTGALNRSRAEMDATVETLKDALMLEAAEESLVEIARDLFDTQMSLTEASEKQAEAYEVLKTQVEEAGYSMQEFEDFHIRYSARLPRTLQKARDAYDEATEAVNKLTNQEAKCNEEYDKINDIINQNTSKLDQNTDSVEGNTKVLVEWKGVTKEVSAEAAADFYEVTAAYEEMNTKAEESIHSQIGLFDEWDSKIEETSKDILSNLDSQISGMQNWATNIQKCAERGINEGLLKELSDMGPSAAGYFDILAKMTDKEIAELNAKYESKLTWEKNVSKELADISTGMTTEFNKMKGKITTETTGIGSAIVAGLQQGIGSKKNSFISGLTELAESAIQTFKKKLKINSPSKVFEEMGEFSGEGYLIGTQKSFAKVNSYLGDAVDTDVISSIGNSTYSIQSVNANDNQGYTVSTITDALVMALQTVNWKVDFEKETMGRIVSDTIMEAYN